MDDAMEKLTESFRQYLSADEMLLLVREAEAADRRLSEFVRLHVIRPYLTLRREQGEVEKSRRASEGRE